VRRSTDVAMQDAGESLVQRFGGFTTEKTSSLDALVGYSAPGKVWMAFGEE
jgi:hypothetical protein